MAGGRNVGDDRWMMSAAVDQHRFGAGSGGRRLGAKRSVLLGALLLAVCASVFMLFAPSYQTATSDSAGNSSTGTATILDVVGPWAIVLAIVPVAIALAPLVAGQRAQQIATIAAAALLVAWSIAGSWTIGMYYVPAVLCLLVAAFVPPRTGAPK